MSAYKYSIGSPFKAHDLDVLRAVFAQINAEVRKSHVILSADDGSFYISHRFSWSGTIKTFFDAYYRICERKQVPPIHQESELSSSLKVPFASMETINLLYGGAYERLLQFKRALIPPFRQLSEKPDIDELKRLAKDTSDKDFRTFLEQVILIIEELSNYVLQLRTLVSAYEQRLYTFYWAERGKKNEKSLASDHKNAEGKILSILNPYILKLKIHNHIPFSWQYSFKNFPIAGEQASLIKDSIVDTYWNQDVLPLVSIRKTREKAEIKIRKKAAAEEKRERARKAKEDARAEKIRIRERKELLREEKKLLRERKKIDAKFEKARLRLSKPSPWMRFNKWVTKIGDWFADNIDDLTTWLMDNFTHLLLVSAAIFVVFTGFKEGIPDAIKLFFGFLFIVGICKYVMPTITDILVTGLSLVLKYVSYIPLFILRCIFFRGWTLILILLCIAVITAIKMLGVSWLI